jgi:hypothetical protein
VHGTPLPMVCVGMRVCTCMCKGGEEGGRTCVSCICSVPGALAAMVVSWSSSPSSSESEQRSTCTHMRMIRTLYYHTPWAFMLC